MRNIRLRQDDEATNSRTSGCLPQQRLKVLKKDLRKPYWEGKDRQVV